MPQCSPRPHLRRSPHPYPQQVGLCFGCVSASGRFGGAQRPPKGDVSECELDSPRRGAPLVFLFGDRIDYRFSIGFRTIGLSPKVTVIFWPFPTISPQSDRGSRPKVTVENYLDPLLFCGILRRAGKSLGATGGGLFQSIKPRPLTSTRALL